MNRRILAIGIAIVLTGCASPGIARAQSSQAGIDLGVHVSTAASSEFDGSDVGVGARVSWRATSLIGIEGEISGYPREFPSERPFSGARWEGLFGVTAGPRMGRVRPFGRLRPGFVSFREASEPVICILIFPPPLACTLASGRTVFALDIGGGVEFLATPRIVFRVDAGDRMLKYPGPAFDGDQTIQQKDFFGHGFRLAVGGALRF